MNFYMEMIKIMLALSFCFLSSICVAQNYDTIRTDSQNVTGSSYVLAKKFIVDIQTFFNSNNERYTISVLLSVEGIKQVSALSDNIVEFIQMDTIPIKIPIFLAYSSLCSDDPIIYGYDWDGSFLLENDNSFSIQFNRSFLIHHPAFLEQLENLKMENDF